MPKSRIAIIMYPWMLPVPAVKGGAIETLVENLLRENEMKDQVEFFVYSTHNEEAYRESTKYKNTSFVYIKTNTFSYFCERVYRRGLSILRKREWVHTYLACVLRDIKRRNIDNVVIEGNGQYIKMIQPFVEYRNVFLHIHSDYFNSVGKDGADIARICKKVIVVSDYIKKRTIDAIGTGISSKVDVLKNGIDLTQFSKKLCPEERIRVRRFYGIGDNDIVLLFTGRTVPEKGVEELIEALRKVSENYPIKLLIVGNAGFGNAIDTEYDRKLRTLASTLKGKILFTGFIHNSQLHKIHGISDIAVVPSVWDEPAGLVVVEAMASGLPLIVTDSGGIPEYSSSECSITVRRTERLVDNLAEAIEQLAKDERLRLNMSIFAKDRAKHFAASNYYDQFIGICRGVD